MLHLKDTDNLLTKKTFGLFQLGFDVLLLTMLLFFVFELSSPVNVVSIYAIPPSSFTSKIRLYGVNNMTGDILFFSTVNNLTKASIVNASLFDMIDRRPHDGTVEIAITIPTTQLKRGMPYEGCIMLLAQAKIICNTRLYLPGQSEQFIDLYLNSSKVLHPATVTIWRSS